MNIIITGTGKGIGFETLKALAGMAGTKIIAISRNQTKVREWINHECKENVIAIDYDLEQTLDFKQIKAAISVHFNYIDILINNAGYLKVQAFGDICEDEFARQLRINTLVPFFLTQSILSLFAKNSHIVNIGSMGGYHGSKKFPGLLAYSTSKGALANMTECMAEELKEKGIYVNCLALGAAQTEMLAQAFPSYKAPLSADQMAGYIAWFAIHGHQYFNGKVLPVALTTP